MPRFETTAQIINDAATEVGLITVADPYGSTDPAFVQLRGLLKTSGQELLGANEWQRLRRDYTINTTTTPPVDPGTPNIYDLPDDFDYMIEQTGWTPTNAGQGMPLGGPLSPQDWTYLIGGGLGPSTVYVSFRLTDGQIWILPNPPPADVDITFEYQSRYWVAEALAPTVLATDSPSSADQVVMYEPILIKKFLKLRYLEAKGFDTTAAAAQFVNMFNQWTGRDKNGPVLNMARNRIFPYLGYRNIPETNYGL